jgi:hypothetical protein
MTRNRKNVSHVRLYMFEVGSLLFRTNDKHCVGKKNAEHIQNVTRKTKPKDDTCISIVNTETNKQETNPPPR